jgi:hypothetical protein
VRGEIRADKVREKTKFVRKIRVGKDLFALDPRLETGNDLFTGSIYAIMLAYHSDELGTHLFPVSRASLFLNNRT